MARRLVAVLIAALALAGCGEAADRRPERAPVESPAVGGFRSDRTYEAVAAPVRLRIPQLRVDTPLQRLGRAADGTIGVPSRPGVAGWYAEGPRPGQAGPAVILGHVDWDGGPAVFFRLTELRPGAVVHVVREDGSTAAFRVTGLSQVPKDRFPTDLVYSPTLQPALRLVTCGGGFDRRTRSYRDNVIVHAVPA
jgi:sortase (surface protein transpeptidase)